MIQARTFAYLAPAVVLYLTVGVVSSAAVDRTGFVIAVVAALLAATPLVVQGGQRGARAAGALGVFAGLGLVRWVSPAPASLLVEYVAIGATALWSALVAEMAFSTPDRLPALMRRVGLRVLLFTLAVAGAAVASLAVAAPLAWGGESWLLPARLARLPWALAAVALLVAMSVRLLRRRLGSPPEALASNAWGLLGLVPATVLAGGLGVAVVLEDTFAFWHSPWARGLWTVCVSLVVVGHGMLVDAQRRLRAGRAARVALASVSTLALVSLAATLLRTWIPRDPAAMALATGATLLCAYGLFSGLLPLTRVWLAPFAGRLLVGVSLAEQRLGGVRDFTQLGQAVLVPLRRASGAVDSRPLLFIVHPSRQCRIDLAGQCHVDSRSLPDALAKWLVERPSELLVRAFLETQVVRRPAVRPLVEWLVEQDVLCVLPLARDSELEGALLVPRGVRRSALTLEELAALENFGRQLAGVVSLLAAEARAETRLGQLQLALERAQERCEQLEDTHARLRSDLSLLKSSRDDRMPTWPMIAYSEGMRGLCERLKRAAPQAAPILLSVEAGDAVEPLVRLVHTESGRAQGSFVVVDCAAVVPGQSAAALFGARREGAAWPGWLRLAEEGTLLLRDVVALPLPVQQALAEALAERQARCADGGAPYALQARIVATARASADALAEQGTLDPELARWLAPLTMRVPPLRERAEDLPSLLLVAVDRACRALGRDTVGLAPEAQTRLVQHPWPGNLAELQWVVEQAVARCEGPRIGLDALAFWLEQPTPGAGEEPPLQGSYDEVEQRLLMYALERADGNKSEAARMLGLARTTFLDKLRKHDLDDRTRAAS